MSNASITAHLFLDGRGAREAGGAGEDRKARPLSTPAAAMRYSSGSLNL